MKESVIENYLCGEVEKIGGLSWKWKCPGRQGVPDRIVMCNGIIVPVETKRPGGKPRKLQDWTHELISSTGNYVMVIDTKDKVDRFVGYLKGLK